ncbi:MAG: hypothetical protein GY953_07545, partial [bacterium]|nr:hypothetical protein [bacterium]
QLEVEFSRTDCPVSERLAYAESVWLPHFVLLGDETDVDDIVTAIEKVVANLDRLSGFDAGVKAASRTARSNLQKDRQW